MVSLANTPAQSFRDLRVWQSAYELTLNIYKTTEQFPASEKFGLASQMTRAAVSVCSNIAEGFGRETPKDKGQFYITANGSLTELENQLLIAHGVGFIDKPTLLAVAQQCSATHKMLHGLQKANKR